MAGTDATGPDPIGLSASTMARATMFLAARAERRPPPAVLANDLRELDLFLSLLIDAVARHVQPVSFDHVRFARQHNTPNKLGVVHLTLGIASPDQERLRAIGRARNRLFHGNRPQSPYLPAWVEREGLTGTTVRRPAADRIMRDLSEICRLYDRIAGELVAAHKAFPAVH